MAVGRPMPSSTSAGELGPRLLERIAIGHQYLRLLAEPAWPTWRDGFSRYQAGELSVPEALSLAHPLWLADRRRQATVQGERRFPREEGSHLARCKAQAIWGYPCDIDAPIQFDHWFPYAFGGPTIAANRLPLCEVHHKSKGADVHLYPWRDEEPSWLSAHLRRMANWI